MPGLCTCGQPANTILETFVNSNQLLFNNTLLTKTTPSVLDKNILFFLQSEFHICMSSYISHIIFQALLNAESFFLQYAVS